MNFKTFLVRPAGVRFETQDNDEKIILLLRQHSITQIIWILFGGGTILLSSGDPDKLNTGKNIIISAVVGLLLVVFAVFILQFIGVEIFDFPGFSD